jgi:hypothetical protein
VFSKTIFPSREAITTPPELKLKDTQVSFGHFNSTRAQLNDTQVSFGHLDPQKLLFMEHDIYFEKGSPKWTCI